MVTRDAPSSQLGAFVVSYIACPIAKILDEGADR